MEISAGAVKELRQRTNAGIMDCKRALQECEGDMEKALDHLQKKGLAKAAKKAGRIASEGIVHAYIHGGRVGVLLEVNCETDFVAKTDRFKEFVNDVALHVAAMNPQYLDETQIPPADLARQQEIFEGQALESGKPEKFIPRIVEGKVNKWKAENCLMSQLFVKDTDKTLDQLQLEVSAETGEKVKIRRYVRWERGEGLEKRTYDLAAEIAEQLEGK